MYKNESILQPKFTHEMLSPLIEDQQLLGYTGMLAFTRAAKDNAIGRYASYPTLPDGYVQVAALSKVLIGDYEPGNTYAMQLAAERAMQMVALGGDLPEPNSEMVSPLITEWRMSDRVRARFMALGMFPTISYQDGLEQLANREKCGPEFVALPPHEYDWVTSYPFVPSYAVARALNLWAAKLTGVRYTLPAAPMVNIPGPYHDPLENVLGLAISVWDVARWLGGGGVGDVVDFLHAQDIIDRQQMRELRGQTTPESLLPYFTRVLDVGGNLL